MAEVDKSMKLVFHEFTRAISEVPLEVFYQTVSSDQYSANGFQFNIKSPGTNALLDCDVWMKYTFMIYDNTNTLRKMFELDGTAIGTNLGNTGTGYPAWTERFCFRGGNIMARSLQNLSVQINNTTLNVQPYKYMDVLNRIYISNDMSEHEFSGSGGRYDEGNHGNKHGIEKFAYNAAINVGRDSGGPFIDGTAGEVKFDGNANQNTNLAGVNWADFFYPYEVWGGLANLVNYNLNMRPPYPIFNQEWTNPGFNKRIHQFQVKCRMEANHSLDAAMGTHPQGSPSAGAGSRFQGQQITLNVSQYYTFEVYERLPIPLFKMYSSDGNYGVIPNIVQMQIQGNFLNTMAENMFKGTATFDTVPNLIDLYWQGMQSHRGELYLRWYTPPVNMPVPREISIPYPKINTWSSQIANFGASAANITTAWYDVPFSHYNITLEAIPDLLLIYVKMSALEYTYNTPDDMLIELRNLTINIDNASGKLNQIQPMDLYQKWKKIVKHQDAKIITYDEWRKYCCVACLQPEDYGVRYGPGYSNQTVLGVTGTARSHWNNPSIGNRAVESLGGDAGACNVYDLHVVSIYNKSRLIIRADGTATQDMTKMAVDFNLIPGGLAPPQIPQQLL